jgi:hypothetical protein
METGESCFIRCELFEKSPCREIEIRVLLGPTLHHVLRTEPLNG